MINPTGEPLGKRLKTAAGGALTVLCLVALVFSLGTAAVLAAAGISTLSAGYPSLGDRGFYYAADPAGNIPSGSLVFFSETGGESVRAGDTVIFRTAQGAMAGECLRKREDENALVVRCAGGALSVPFAAVIGVAESSDPSAGKLIGALGKSHPASSAVLFAIGGAYAVLWIALALVRRRKKGREQSRQNADE